MDLAPIFLWICWGLWENCELVRDRFSIKLIFLVSIKFFRLTLLMVKTPQLILIGQQCLEDNYCFHAFQMSTWLYIVFDLDQHRWTDGLMVIEVVYFHLDCGSNSNHSMRQNKTKKTKITKNNWRGRFIIDF